MASLLLAMAILLKRRRTRIKRLEKLLALLHYDLASQLANGFPPCPTGSDQPARLKGADPLRDWLTRTHGAKTGNGHRG